MPSSGLRCCCCCTDSAMFCSQSEEKERRVADRKKEREANKRLHNVLLCLCCVCINSHALRKERRRESECRHDEVATFCCVGFSQAASHLYLIISLPPSSSSNSFFFCIFCIPIHLFSSHPQSSDLYQVYSPQPSDMMAAQPSITTTPKSWSQMVSREQQQTNQSVLETGSDPLSSCGSTLPLVSRLEDIMSEELAQELTFDHSKSQTSQSQSQPVPGTSSGGDGATATSENLAVFLAEAGLSTTDLKELSESSDVCSNDEMLAKLLQRELDLEHDRRVKAEEKNYNAHSKVKLSFENQRYLKDGDLHYSDLEDEESYHEYGEASQHWDFFEKTEKSSPAIGRAGFSVDKESGRVTTKHDIERAKARNASKVMEFESDIRTGDGGGFPMKLNNSVYNALRVHSISEGKRMARLHEKKEKSSAEKAIDEKSRILLFKLINRGILESMNGIISTGKESVVVHGLGENPEKGITMGEVAIKIFKTTITEFRNRVQYIVGDPVLEQTGKLSKGNPKLTIPLWAEKEMHNLNRIRRVGIPCPEVVLLKKHILVMSFIGKDGRAAPTLKNLIYSSTEMVEEIWSQVVALMVKLFQEADLVHGDLSAYNLLWHEGKVVVIDVSQAVRSTHPHAFTFLYRDIRNICKFFSKKMTLPMEATEIFALVTGKDVSSLGDDDIDTGIELLDKMENYEKNEEKLRKSETGPDIFDQLFEKSLKERESANADAAEAASGN